MPPHDRPHSHPHHHPHPHPHHHPGDAHLPSSTVTAAIGRATLEPILAQFLADPNDRAFVARCIAEDGPIHHRGSSHALIRLLALALDAAGGAPAPTPGAPPAPSTPTVPVPMRLPPHLGRRDDGEHDFPIALPLAPLLRLAPAGSRELDALVDCLTDGPSHHALANAVMVSLLGALLERLTPAAPNAAP